MNEISKGVVAVAVSLYAWVQDREIDNGTFGQDERITTELIRKVALSDQFRLLNEQLSAIDTGDGKCVKDVDGEAQWNHENTQITGAEGMTKMHTDISTNEDMSEKTSIYDASIPKWDADPIAGVGKMREEGCLLTQDDPF